MSKKLQDGKNVTPKIQPAEPPIIQSGPSIFQEPKIQDKPPMMKIQPGPPSFQSGPPKIQVGPPKMKFQSKEPVIQASMLKKKFPCGQRKPEMEFQRPPQIQAGPPRMKFQSGPPKYQAGPSRMEIQSKEPVIQAAPPSDDELFDQLSTVKSVEKKDPFEDEQKKLASSYPAVITIWIIEYWRPVIKGNLRSEERAAEGVSLAGNFLRTGSQGHSVWSSTGSNTIRAITPDESKKVLEFIEKKGMHKPSFWKQNTKKQGRSVRKMRMPRQSLGPTTHKIWMVLDSKKINENMELRNLCDESYQAVMDLELFLQKFLVKSRTFKRSSDRIFSEYYRCNSMKKKVFSEEKTKPEKQFIKFKLLPKRGAIKKTQLPPGTSPTKFLKPLPPGATSQKSNET